MKVIQVALFIEATTYWTDAPLGKPYLKLLVCLFLGGVKKTALEFALRGLGTIKVASCCPG
jgi:hypothetical protein